MLLALVLACSQPAPPPVTPAVECAPCAGEDVLAVALQAALDDPDAQYDLAVRFFSGDGVPQDPARAALLWERVAETGDPTAQSNLGFVLLTGHGGIPADPERALVYLHQASASGHSEAAVHLAWAHAHGVGVPVDPVEAWAWAEVGRRRALTRDPSEIGGAVAANARRLQESIELTEADRIAALALADAREPL